MKPLVPLSLIALFVLTASAQPLPLAATAEPAQRHASVAASAHGYAVVWREDTSAISSSAYLRRFSAAGTPFDVAPIPIVTLITPLGYGFLPAEVTIAANASTYIVGWSEPFDGFVFRRMAADSGAWIDAQPISLGFALDRFASNGTDVVAAGFTSCGANIQCLQARRISLAGDPQVSAPVTLRIPKTDDFYMKESTIASNGSDYLVAWAEAPLCKSVDLCSGPPPAQVYALRVRADGTPIDPAPIVLENSNRPASGLSIAWAGGRYLIVWNIYGAIVGTRITSDGAVLDRDPTAGGGGVLLAQADPSRLNPITGTFIDAALAGLENRFVLLLRHDAEAFPNPLPPVHTSSAESVTFAADADLATVITLPRTPLFKPDDLLGDSLALATNGRSLAVAFTAGETNSMHVFLRLLEPPPPARRRSAH